MGVMRSRVMVGVGKGSKETVLGDLLFFFASNEDLHEGGCTSYIGHGGWVKLWGWTGFNVLKKKKRKLKEHKRIRTVKNPTLYTHHCTQHSHCSMGNDVNKTK